MAWRSRRRGRVVQVGPIHDEVHRCAELTGLAVPPITVQARGGARGHARRRRRSSEIVLGAGLIDAPEPVQRWVAAHEFAHVACGHTSQRRWWMDLSLGVHVLGGLGLLGWLVATFPHVSAGQHVAQLLLFGTFVVLLGFYAASQRVRETSADRYAAGVLQRPLTREVADWCAQHVSEPHPPRWLSWLRTHPTWAERVELCRPLLPAHPADTDEV